MFPISCNNLEKYDDPSVKLILKPLIAALKKQWIKTVQARAIL